VAVTFFKLKYRLTYRCSWQSKNGDQDTLLCKRKF